jgi:hypothetical protein
MLETDSTNNLHGIHSSPRLPQSREFPQYDPVAENITPRKENESQCVGQSFILW